MLFGLTSCLHQEHEVVLALQVYSLLSNIVLHYIVWPNLTSVFQFEFTHYCIIMACTALFGQFLANVFCQYTIQSYHTAKFDLTSFLWQLANVLFRFTNYYTLHFL